MADGQPAPRTPEAIFRAARRGDPQAISLVTQATEALAVAMAAMAAVIEPEVIVVGGSIGLGQPRMMRRAAALARTRVMRENAATLRVVPAGLGQESVLAGAADLGLRLLDGS
jgi:glucokinase